MLLTGRVLPFVSEYGNRSCERVWLSVPRRTALTPEYYVREEESGAESCQVPSVSTACLSAALSDKEICSATYRSLPINKIKYDRSEAVSLPSFSDAPRINCRLPKSWLVNKTNFDKKIFKPKLHTTFFHVKHKV